MSVLLTTTTASFAAAGFTYAAASPLGDLVLTGPTHTNVIFDCVRPSDLAMSAEDLKRALAKRVESEYPKSVAKITIDEDYVGHTHE